MVLGLPFFSHEYGCCALCFPCSSLPQVILGDASPEICRPLLAAFEEGLWPSAALRLHSSPSLSPSFAGHVRHRVAALARALTRARGPQGRQRPRAGAVGSGRGGHGSSSLARSPFFPLFPAQDHLGSPGSVKLADFGFARVALVGGSGRERLPLLLHFALLYLPLHLLLSL